MSTFWGKDQLQKPCRRFDTLSLRHCIYKFYLEFSRFSHGQGFEVGQQFFISGFVKYHSSYTISGLFNTNWVSILTELYQ